jgi:hypothetical protein
MSPPATLLVDAGYLTILGGLLGWIAALRPGRRAGIGAIATLLIAGIGVPAFFYARWAEWMWAFYADPAKVPGWIVVMLFALYAPVYGCAFFLARGAGRRGWCVVALGIAIQIALVAATWERYRRSGQFAGRPGPGDGEMALATAVVVLVVIAAAAYALREKPQPAE